MAKRYTITLTSEAAERLRQLLKLVGQDEDKLQTGLQNWLHALFNLEPPRWGGERQIPEGKPGAKKKGKGK